jgi:hypothetical protein
LHVIEIFRSALLRHRKPGTQGFRHFRQMRCGMISLRIRGTLTAAQDEQFYTFAIGPDLWDIPAARAVLKAARTGLPVSKRLSSLAVTRRCRWFHQTTIAMTVTRFADQAVGAAEHRVLFVDDRRQPARRRGESLWVPTDNRQIR